MPSITILKPLEKQHDLTLTEKKELFASIQVQTDLPQYHFDNFICHSTYTDYYDITESKFLNLELKRILNWISPILSEIPCRQNTQEASLSQYKKSKQRTAKTFREVASLRAAKKRIFHKLDAVPNRYCIVLQTETPLKGFVRKKVQVKQSKSRAKGSNSLIYKTVYESYIVPAYNQFNVIGIRLDFLSRNGKFYKISENRNFPVNTVPIEQLIKTGYYNLNSPDYINFINQSLSINLPKYLDHGSTNIIFTDEKHAQSVVRGILHIITDMKYHLDHLYLSTMMIINNMTKITKVGYAKLKNPVSTSNSTSSDSTVSRIRRSKPNSPIITELQKIYSGKFSSIFPSGRYNDMISGNMLDIYYKAILLGLNHKDVKLLLNNARTSVDVVKRSKKNKYDRFKVDSRTTFFNYWGNTKFGMKFIELNEQQQRYIKLLYKKFDGIQSTSHKDCEHLKIINKMRYSIIKSFGLSGPRIKENYEELSSIYKIIIKMFDMKPYVAPTIYGKSNKPSAISPEQLLNCINCTVPLLCPHYITHMTLILDNKPASYIRSYLLTVYAKITLNNSSYCKICGEKLTSTIDTSTFQFKKGMRFLTVSDPLYNIVISEVARATRFLTSKVLINRKNIITTITASIKPELDNIEALLKKSRTNTKEHIQNMMLMYASIYAIASLVVLIDKNSSELSFSIQDKPPRPSRFVKTGRAELINLVTDDINIDDGFAKFITEPLTTMLAPIKIELGGTLKGGARSKRFTPLQFLMKQALIILLSTKKTLINNIPNFTHALVKPLLIRAWRWASGKTVIDVKTSEESHKIEVSLALDPFYSYVYQIATIDRSAKLVDTNFDILLGKSLKVIEKTHAFMYADVYIPSNKLWKENIWNEYIYNAYRSIADYTKKQMFNYFVIPTNLKLAEYENKLNKLRVEEMQFYNITMLHRYKPYTILKADTQWNIIRPIYLSDVYCASGERHKFNIFIYKTKSSVKEFSDEYIKDCIVPNAKRAEEFAKFQFIDRRCSICKVKESQTTPKFDKKIRANLDNKLLQEGFYTIFETKCPVKGVHEFGTSGTKCKKCNVTKDILIKKGITSYYNKYKKIYLDYLNVRNKNRCIDWNINKLNEQLLAQVPKTKKFPKWKNTYALVTKWSKLSKIPYNVLINLGLTEHLIYTDIESGKDNPYTKLNEDHMINRYLKLDNIIRDIFKDYFSIKNYERSIFNKLLQNIIDKQKKHTTKGLSHMMFDIVQNYYDRLAYYGSTETPSLISNYILHTIASVILQIYDMFKKSKFKHLGVDLFEYFNDKIVTGEKTFSKQERKQIKHVDKIQLAVDNDTFIESMNLQEAESRGMDIESEVYDPFSVSDIIDVDDDDIEDDTQGKLDDIGKND